MAISRRDFLITATAGGLGAAGAFAESRAAPVGDLYAGCHTDAGGNHFVTLFRLSGTVHARHRLPGRGHGIVYDADARRFVVLARRPGRFAVVIDARSGELTDTFDAREDRHFYGHGVFSRDGRWLYTSENDFEAGRGVVGVRDARRGFRLERELSSHGIGPHQILFSPAGDLVIANGGIRTHPDTGRAKLNVDTMQPSLVMIDANDGRLITRAALEPRLHELSIRHIDVAPGGEVAMAMQYQGAKQDRVPLVAVWRRGRVETWRAPEPVERRMRQYTGGTVFDASGAYLAVTCPRGNMVTFWSAVSGQFLHACDVDDGCGVAAHADGGTFVVTGRADGCTLVDAASGRQWHSQGHVPGRWDNHLTVAHA